MAYCYLPLLDENIKSAFWAKVIVAGIDDCWEWTAFRNKGGYGKIGFRRDGKSLTFIATHVALHMDGRHRPPGAIALHSCDNPGCCNPKHLRWGDHFENEKDKMSRGRLHPREKRSATMKVRAARGESHTCAVLNGELVRKIRADNRSGYAIGRDFGVSQQTVSDVKNRKTWAHID